MTERARVTGNVDVGGVRLRYVVEGSCIPALVIGSAVYYPRTFSARLRKALRLAFTDLRHFAESGVSQGSDVLSLERYIADIENVRIDLELDRAVIIGHSHHGNLALEYAKRYPARVSHVVLIGSAPVEVNSTVRAAAMYWESHASATRKAMLRENLSGVGSDGLDRLTPEQAFVLRYVAEGPKYWYDPSYNASQLWKGVPVNMGALKAFRDFFADGYEMQWDPERLAAPVLVIMGRYDYAVPPILWDGALPALTNLTFHIFEHSGHTPQLEEPEQFDRVLLDWLETST